MTQWNPAHRAICKIKGWEPFVFATWADLDQKFSMLKVFLKPQNYFDYGIQGGSFDLRTYTLDQFYKKHLLGWNIWTRSNEGFDLARYMGTKWTFYPHPHQAYFVFWERNWETTEFEQLPLMHPAWLMTHRRNTILVLPRSYRGRKKRIIIRPPSLQTSHWFYAASWVATALFRIGVCPVNLEWPFVHNASAEAQPRYAVFIGWGQPPTTNQKVPLPVPWTVNSFKTIANSVTKINYRWWWDTGTENYILINSVQNSPTNHPTINLQVLPVHHPYYIFFYGAMLPQGKPKVNNNTDLPTSNPQLMGATNPSPIAIWWYYDRVAYYYPDTRTPQMDTRYLRPEDLPQQGRTWVFLWNDTASFGSGVQFDSDLQMENAWDTNMIAPIIQRIVENSPFVMGRFDIPMGQRQFNVTARYTSIWQWGGTIPKPDSVLNPEQLVDRGEKPPQASIRNPATVGYANLHPWDLTQGGSIVESRLREMLTDILTSPGPAPPDASRAASPEPPHRRHRDRYERRRRKRPRSPTPTSESDESDGHPSSSSSSERQWKSRTPSSSEESESEEEPPTPPPPKRPQLLLRRPLLR